MGMMGKTTPEQFRKMAASERLEYDALLNRYGDGVRPSWVSEQLSYHGRRAKYYDDMADALDVEVTIEDDGFVTIHPKVTKDD